MPLALELKDSLEDPVTLTVEVNAALFVGPGLDSSVESLMDAGLVTVQVQALTEFVTAEDGSLVRRVTLQETIVEVNNEGTPVLLVEQNALMALDVAKRAYVMETGRIALEGPASELKTNERVRATYLGED